MVLPMERFLGSRSSDSMVLDPVMLDGAAGQLLGAWLYERIADPGTMYPVQIDEITLYSSAPRPGT